MHLTLRLLLLPMCILLRRTHVLLRASAFATTPPVAPFPSRTRTTTTFFSSTQDKTSIPTNVEPYLPITGLQQPKAFGGLTYVETSEELQRVVFVLGGPGSGKVSTVLFVYNAHKSTLCLSVLTSLQTFPIPVVPMDTIPLNILREPKVI